MSPHATQIFKPLLGPRVEFVRTSRLHLLTPLMLSSKTRMGLKLSNSKSLTFQIFKRLHKCIISFVNDLGSLSIPSYHSEAGFQPADRNIYNQISESNFGARTPADNWLSRSFKHSPLFLMTFNSKRYRKRCENT